MSEGSNPAGLSGKAALVTGATGGIGCAIAKALVQKGVRVGLVARGRDGLDALAGELGGWSLPCDVTNPRALSKLRDEFVRLAGGPPDVIVTSAGVFSIQSIDEMSPDVLDHNLAVNLRGTVLTVQAFLPGLKRRESGTIIQIGSIAGRKAFAGNGAYSASKFGVRGFHEVLLEELRGTGVRATLLEPAATNTSIWDSIEAERSPDIPDRESMLDPKSVAACVVFVAARSAGVQIPYLPVEAI